MQLIAISKTKILFAILLREASSFHGTPARIHPFVIIGKRWQGEGAFPDDAALSPHSGSGRFGPDAVQ